MLYILLMAVHVFVCLVLILVILLQAGRGGGFSDMAGGGQPQSILGTQTNAFMTRATEVCAILFIITSLSLGIISTHRGKSLMERQRGLTQVAPSAVPAPAVQPVTQNTASANTTAKSVSAEPAKTEAKPADSSTASATPVPAKPADSSH